MRELMIHQPIFIGIKADRQLREKLESLSDSEQKYVSRGTSAFLQLYEVEENLYVGKLVKERLTTDRIDDICRNVLSILRKLGQEVRLPKHLQVLACSGAESGGLARGTGH